MSKAVFIISESLKKEIACELFDERLLKGSGSIKAANEVARHCELLIISGDVVTVNDKKYASTGNTNFKGHIENLSPDH